MSGCADVCLSADVDGYGETISQTTPRSRTERNCGECGGVIAVGQKYERYYGKWDGDTFTAITCLPCAEIRDAFFCGGWLFGEIWEQICDEMFPVWRTKGPWDCLAKLTTPEAIALCNTKFREWREAHCYDEPDVAASPRDPSREKNDAEG